MLLGKGAYAGAYVAYLLGARSILWSTYQLKMSCRNDWSLSLIVGCDFIQAAILPGPDKGVELVKGDVFQYATLPSAIGDRYGY